MGLQTMITPEYATQPDAELPSPRPADDVPVGSNLGELPQQFYARLTRLLAAFPQSTLASVHPAKQPGSWAVEVLFADRRETFVVIYAPDQVAV